MVVALVLFLLATLHLYWAVRGAGGSVAIPTRRDGSPVLRPTRATSLAVALALFLAALLVASQANLIDLGLPRLLVRIGTWGVAIAFLARTIGEFRYVGLFKKVHGTPFARWDTRLFTPLCAAIAFGTFMLV